jgi:hypothetical protein
MGFEKMADDVLRIRLEDLVPDGEHEVIVPRYFLELCLDLLKEAAPYVMLGGPEDANMSLAIGQLRTILSKSERGAARGEEKP